jgi:predicted nucleotide-binding protein
MPKLHELLAVEKNLKSQADKTRLELSATFGKKTHHFTQKVVTFRPIQENVPPVTEEQLDLQTTVPREIKWVSSFIVKSLDASYQVDEGNTQARADVVLEDGTVLLEAVPTTGLLRLEHRLKELHDFVVAIPTLDPAKGFRPDESVGTDVFKARDDVRPRTKKTLKYKSNWLQPRISSRRRSRISWRMR